MALQIAQLRREDLDKGVVLFQKVSLGQAEEAQDLQERGVRTGSVLWIEREFVDSIALHPLSDLPFDEGLKEEPQEVQEEERFDARLAGYMPSVFWS